MTSTFKLAAWTALGKQVAAGSSRTVRLWDAETAACVKTLVGHGAVPQKQTQTAQATSAEI